MIQFFSIIIVIEMTEDGSLLFGLQDVSGISVRDTNTSENTIVYHVFLVGSRILPGRVVSIVRTQWSLTTNGLPIGAGAVRNGTMWGLFANQAAEMRAGSP